MVVAFALAAAPLARADDAKSAAVFAEAKAKYGVGDYVVAAELFVKAYALDPDPAYLFNVAQSYRLADNCEQAAHYYEQFLAKVANPPNLDAIHGWLADAKKCAELRKPKKIETHEPPPPPPKHEVIQPKPAPSKTLAIVVTGVGVVALGAAGYFTWDTSHIAHQRDDFSVANCMVMMACRGADLKKFDDDGHRARAIAVGGFAVGGLAVAGGVLLWLKAGKPEQPPIAVSPTKGGVVFAAGLSF